MDRYTGRLDATEIILKMAIHKIEANQPIDLGPYSPTILKNFFFFCNCRSGLVVRASAS